METSTRADDCQLNAPVSGITLSDSAAWVYLKGTVDNMTEVVLEANAWDCIMNKTVMYSIQSDK